MSFSFTYLIIFLTAAVSLYALDKPILYNKLMMNPYLAAHKKEYYRFLTSALIHNGYIHLIFNMLTFYFFAVWLEKYWFAMHEYKGWLYFLILYIGGVIVSDLPTYWKYKDAPYYNSLGASGGVSSVVFATILYSPMQKLCLYGIFCFPAFIMGAVYLIYSYVHSKESAGGDNINHSAHFYGAVFGLAFAAIVEPEAILTFFAQISEWRLF